MPVPTTTTFLDYGANDLLLVVAVLMDLYTVQSALCVCVWKT